jgi:hypothetical protein
MFARVRWSQVVVLSTTVLTMLLAAGCAARRAPVAPLEDLDHSSLVRGHACDRSDQDTTHYLHLPLYRACAVSVAARRVANDLRPEFWPSGRDRNCFSALVEVAVDTLGRPELRSTRLVRATDPGYAASVLAIVPGLRFEPARLGGRPVRQIFELHETLLIRRGRGLEGAGGQRQQVSGTRATRPAATAPPASMSEAPAGAELPTLQSLGGVC